MAKVLIYDARDPQYSKYLELMFSMLAHLQLSSEGGPGGDIKEIRIASKGTVYGTSQS